MGYISQRLYHLVGYHHLLNPSSNFFVSFSVITIVINIAGSFLSSMMMASLMQLKGRFSVPIALEKHCFSLINRAIAQKGYSLFLESRSLINAGSGTASFCSWLFTFICFPKENLNGV